MDSSTPYYVHDLPVPAYGDTSDIGIALNYALFALINEGVDYGEENLR